MSDCHDTALAETINDLHKAKVIRIYRPRGRLDLVQAKTPGALRRASVDR